MTIVIEKPKKICEDHYLLKLNAGNKVSIPGQFINIKLNDQTDPLLRRPFSVYNQDKNIIEIIFKVVGKGTRLLKKINKSEKLDIILPRGTGFSITEKKNVLLIGGGIGNAPLYYLSKKLKSKHNSVSYIFAAKSKDYIYLQDDFSLYTDNYYLSTDDGSEGYKGYASDLAKDIIKKNKFDKIYVCGPTPMMKSLVEIINASNTSFEISVENYFGCGIGLCSGCAIETTEGMLRACIDGPVFDGAIILWDAI